MKKKDIIKIVIGAVIILIVLCFVSRYIIVDKCAVPCDCQYDASGIRCSTMGCAQISLWDFITCRLAHIFG